MVLHPAHVGIEKVGDHAGGGEEKRGRGSGGKEERRRGGGEKRIEKSLGICKTFTALLTKSCASSLTVREVMRMRRSCTGFSSQI